MQTRTFSAFRANAVRQATVEVRVGSKTGPLATDLVDGNGDPLENPFPLPSIGRVDIGAPDGTYWINIVGPGFSVWEQAQFLDAQTVIDWQENLALALEAAIDAQEAEAGASVSASIAQSALLSVNLTAAQVGINLRLPDRNNMFIWEDFEGRPVMTIDVDGLLRAKQESLQLKNWEFMEVMRLPDGSSTTNFMVVSKNNRILGKLIAFKTDPQQQIDEIIDEQEEINARLDYAINPQGDLNRGYFNENTLPRTRYKLEKLALGEQEVLNIGVLGDSYSQNYQRWTGPIATQLAAAFGDAGGGYTSYAAATPTFNNNNARPSLYPYFRSGTWVISAYTTSISPDIGQISSSEVGAKITRGGNNAALVEHVALFYRSTSDGVIKYRYGSGSWTEVELQEGTVGDLNFAQLGTGIPASGAWTLEIEVASGTVILCGDMCVVKSGVKGVTFSKLAATGSRAGQYVAANREQWVKGIAQLDLHAMFIMWGPNDQGQGVPAATFATQVAEVIDRCREAKPLMDIIIMIAAEVPLQPRPVAMSAYASALAKVAHEKRCAFINFQYYFGAEPADYAFDGPCPLMESDGIHPTNLTGGRLIASTAWRMLTSW